VFQNTHTLEPAMAMAGSVDDWRRHVAALAIGNSRLTLALSMAFAAPLLQIVNEESGAIHLRGPSSCGKTTIIRAAASVWGAPRHYVRQWRATTNGLEGIAALHNDGLLILDELSQIDPKAAGEAAYMLANGQGKIRASRTGAARVPLRWQLLVLSAGEEGLNDLMAKAGLKANAGQEIRLADIDADAGMNFGAFEVLHRCLTAEEFALTLRDASNQYYGTVGIEWLRHLVVDRGQLPERLIEGMRAFVQAVVPDDAGGQAARVARRFGVIAAAGELASYYGLTGWPAGEAIAGAKKAFASWLSARGEGNQEERRLFAQVRAFVQAYGESRFDGVSGDGGRMAINRAGFHRMDEEGHRVYWILSEIFRNEVIKGFPENWAKRILAGDGMLQKFETRFSYKPNIPGVGRPRVYVLTPRVLEG
jgi:putative DNA primase/helicase